MSVDLPEPEGPMIATYSPLPACLGGSGVVHADPLSGLQGPQGFVAAADDFVAFPEAGQHLDVGNAADARLDGLEKGIWAANHKYTFQFLLVAGVRAGRRSGRFRNA